MRRFLFPLTLASILPLGGCEVGPDYHAPSFDAPSIWHESKPAESAQRDKNVAWWQDFDDPALNALVDKALAGNEDLKIAVARVVEARGLRDSAAGALFPQVGAGAGALRGDPGVPTLGGDLGQTQAAFDASWEIDLFGGTRRKVEAQDASIVMAEAAWRNASLILVAEVAREYITLRQLQAQLIRPETKCSPVGRPHDILT